MSVAQDDAELVRRLVELNLAVSSGQRAYTPFAHSPQGGAVDGVDSV